MPWIDFEDDSNRTWQINQEGLYLLARGSARAASARRNTREIVSGEGWFDGPRMVEIQTDWGKVNRETGPAGQRLYFSLANEVLMHPENSARNLAHMLTETRTNQNYIRDLQQRTTSSNMAAVSSHVTNWEHGLAATRFVRDTSWTVLILLSAIPTGGTSAGGAAALSGGVRVAALGVGSVGRGQAVYQDTGNVGAAVINGTGSFITGAIGLPPGGGLALSSGQQAVVLGIQSASAGGFAGMQSLAEGHTAEAAGWQALSAAGFNAAGGSMSGTPAFTNASLPVQLSIQVANETIGSLINNEITSSDTNGSLTLPQSGGRIIHAGVPTQPSADTTFIRTNVLRQKP